ncbi:MAG: DUF4230 domain-containing protein, partial [bacterium]
MRKLLYLILIIFFAVSAFAVFSIAMTLNTARDATAPVGELVRRLAVPATPVILPDPVVIVQEVKDLARLETASYGMEKVIRAERGQDVLWGALGETMIFVAHGEVIAGVDLAKMEEEDVQVVDPVTVMIYLPEAEIFNVVLDNERSYVADRDTGLLTRANPQLESEVRRSAQSELEAAAVESDILVRANENAENYMRRFLQGLGFENVIFTDSTPPPAPPFEQEAPKGYT